MEWKAHYLRDFGPLEQMSRVKDDLSMSTHNGVPFHRLADAKMLRRAVPAGRIPHVCIVGAGVAGLRCADILSRHVKVTILEARDRIGGRVGAASTHKNPG